MKVQLRILIVAFFFSLAFYHPPSVVFAEEGQGASPGSVSEEAAGMDEALRLKSAGDEFVKTDNVKEAARNYLNALSLYDGFTNVEKVEMAIIISWADKLDDALKILDAVIADDPLYVKARIERARVLSWQDRLYEAQEESEKALELDPEESDARLIKANSLNWRGKSKESIPIYEDLLDEGENFEARLNLSYAYLSAGEREKASESAKELKPGFSYQEEQAAKAVRLIKRGTRPNMNIGYNYYSDTDSTFYNKYYVNATFYRNDLTIVPSYFRIYPRANDEVTKASIRGDAYNVSLNVFKKNSEVLGTRAGVGYTHLKNGGDSGYFVGNIGADYITRRGWLLDASVKHDVYVVTPVLIKNRIRYTDVALNASKDLTHRVSLSTSVSFKDISDGNSMVAMHIAPSYHLLKANPKLSVGYMFRAMNYRTQKGNAYFDPSDFISNHVFGSLFYEKERFYTNLHLYTGYQSFTRNGFDSSDWYSGWVALLGYNITDRTSVELNSEGGDFSVSSAAGFRYYIVGVNLHHAF